MPSVTIDSVTLENIIEDDNEVVSIIVEAKTQEKISGREAQRWYSDIDFSRFVRVRIVACLDATQAPSLDYLQQRFNEYIDLSEAGIADLNAQDFVKSQYDKMGPINGDDFSRLARSPEGPIVQIPLNQDLIAEAASDQDGNLVPEDGILRPYYVQSPQERFSNSRTLALPQENNLSGIILFDDSLKDLLLLDAEGEVPAREVQQIARNIVNQEETFLYDEVPLQTIKLSVGPGTIYPDGQLSHLSLYAFSYIDYGLFVEQIGVEEENENMQFRYILNSLNSGMGKVNNSTVIGKQTSYDPIEIRTTESTEGLVEYVSTNQSIGNISDRIGETTTLQLNSPQQNLLFDLRRTNFPKFDRFKTKFYDSFYGSLDNSLLGKSNLKIIHNDNFFSDFWFSKDDDDNIRYTYAFNILSFLAQNSKFPRLYTNRETSEELLGGGDIIQFNEVVDERARVLNIEAKKRLVDFNAFTNDNDLGTVVRQKRKTLEAHLTEKIIQSPKILPNIRLPGQGQDPISAFRGSGITFYEGYDSLESEHLLQNVSKYQYGFKCYVSDPAQLYIERSLQRLIGAEGLVNEYYNTVINSLNLYDPATGKITKDPSEITIDNIPANDLLAEQVRIFVSYLRKYRVPIKKSEFKGTEIGNVSIRDYRSVESVLLSLVNSPFPGAVKQVADTIGMLVSDLASIVGTLNPKGATYEASGEKFTLENSTTPVAIREAENYFDETVEAGVTKGLGYDYFGDFKRDLLTTEIEQNQGQDIRGRILREVGEPVGPTRIPVEIYRTRVGREFNKYFCRAIEAAQPEDNGPIVYEQMEYQDPAYRYLSPVFIRRPGKERIDQLSYFPITNDVNAPYNFDEYADFFADIIKSKRSMKYAEKPYYELVTDNTIDSLQIKTANSLIETLSIDHGCTVLEQIDQQFTVPSPTTISPATTVTFSTQELLPSILGGNNLGIAASEFSAQSIQDALDEQRLSDESQNPARLSEALGPATKLLFTLVGELEIQPTPDSISYYEENFNSSTRMKQIFEADHRNVKQLIETPQLGFIPNQLKSMLVWSTSIPEQALGEVGPKFDARRVLLRQQDMLVPSDGSPFDPSIYSTYYDPAGDNPHFLMTRDPMKIYSKFLAFWMNYKQLGIVEYLSHFDSVSPTFRIDGDDDLVRGSKLGRPVWMKMTADVADQLSSGQLGIGNVLCRIRTASNEDVLADGSLTDRVNEETRNRGEGQGERDNNQAFDPFPVDELPAIDFDFQAFRTPLILRPRDIPSLAPPVNFQPPGFPRPSILSPVAPVQLNQPGLATPNLVSPRLATPNLVSPRLATPNLVSPRLATPSLASPVTRTQNTRQRTAQAQRQSPQVQQNNGQGSQFSVALPRRQQFSFAGGGARNVSVSRGVSPRGRLYQAAPNSRNTREQDREVDQEQVDQDIQNYGLHGADQSENSQTISDDLVRSLVENNFEFLSRKEIFNLPIYHEYFYMSFGYSIPDPDRRTELLGEREIPQMRIPAEEARLEAPDGLPNVSRQEADRVQREAQAQAGSPSERRVRQDAQAQGSRSNINTRGIGRL